MSFAQKPVLLGGEPLFKEVVPIIKPNIDLFSGLEFLNKVSDVMKSNMVSGVNIKVKEFENLIEAYIGVPHAVCVSSATSGLMLVIRALNLSNQEIIMPSFTFSATMHAAVWNECKVVFADIDSDTFNISIDDIRRKITKNTKAIIAVNMYGNPCNVEELENLAKEFNIKLIFDSAHALGAEYRGGKVGQFGDAEVFSTSPTKLLTTFEGGIVSTRDGDLMEKIVLARNYGNKPNLDSMSVGLNARMNEISALLGIDQIDKLEEYVVNRNRYASLFKYFLKDIPGIKFQKVALGDVSTFKDFGFIVNESKFGLSRTALAIALSHEKVMTKFYFDPPIHKLKIYKQKYAGIRLPQTDNLSKNIICLPIYNYMSEDLINELAQSIKRIYLNRKAVKKKISEMLLKND